MSSFKFYSLGGFLLRKKSEKCIAFSRPEFALQTRAFQGYVRTSCYLHSFATLRNWLRQPLQSLPQFKIKKLEIEPNKNKNTINTILSLQKMIKCQNIENYFIRVFYEKHSKQMD